MLSIAAEPVPLEKDQRGTIRIVNSRVTLDTIVANFEKGATAEKIAESFPTLNLADIYSIIGYYLHHRAEVKEYLADQASEASKIQQKVEERWPAAGLP